MMDTMTDDMTVATRAMVTDHFQRIADAVARVADGLSQPAALWRPDPDANSIAWLLWHLTRVQDDHVAHLAGREQVWTAGGWYQRFQLPFEPAAHGYGHSSAEVAAVTTAPSELAAYHAAVHEMCRDYAATLTAAELERVVDTSWDPPVTAAVRLVSLLGDCLAHLGQADYVRGMARRAGID